MFGEYPVDLAVGGCSFVGESIGYTTPDRLVGEVEISWGISCDWGTPKFGWGGMY